MARPGDGYAQGVSVSASAARTCPRPSSASTATSAHEPVRPDRPHVRAHAPARSAIARQIAEALGDARSVVNVGAGAGAYEPRDRDVVAVEPSSVMLRQRPLDAAPAVLGSAEEIPFGDGPFDAALAVLTMHHWGDWRAGRRRDAARRAPTGRDADFRPRPTSPATGSCVTTCPRSRSSTSSGFRRSRSSPTRSAARSRPGADSGGLHRRVPVRRWRRPLAYLDEAVRANISSFATLGPEALAAALARLEHDVADGTWAERNADLIARDEADSATGCWSRSWLDDQVRLHYDPHEWGQAPHVRGQAPLVRPAPSHPRGS